MPTIEQLNQNIMAQHIGLTAAHGLGPEHADHIPSPHYRFHQSKGEIIGHVVWDEENDGMKIIPLRQFIAPAEMPVQKLLPAPKI